MPGRKSDRWMRPLVITGFLLNVTTGYTAEPEPGPMRIESDPAGAAVSSIVGGLGFTPLSIDARDIFPNVYPDKKLELYGKVTLSKTGCRTVTRRVTPADIRRGLNIRMDCAAPVATADKHAEVKTQVVQKPAAPAPVAEPLSERRLRQLKVLDELLDEGLISVQEERTIRKRILGPVDTAPPPADITHGR